MALLDLRHITLDDVARDMANIVTEYGPQHRAPRINGGCTNWHAVDPDTGKATFAHGADSPLTHVPSCIVGLWLFRQGVTLDMLRRRNAVGVGVLGVSDTIVRFRPDVEIYLMNLQNYQDGTGLSDPNGSSYLEPVDNLAAFGRPWGAALAYANAMRDKDVVDADNV